MSVFVFLINVYINQFRTRNSFRIKIMEKKNKARKENENSFYPYFRLDSFVLGKQNDDDEDEDGDNDDDE